MSTELLIAAAFPVTKIVMFVMAMGLVLGSNLVAARMDTENKDRQRKLTTLAWITVIIIVVTPVASIAYHLVK